MAKLVIIGAGISGLAAGVYGLKYGFDVEIIERNTSVGGLCTGWTRKGSYIDGCVHWLTESNRGVMHKLMNEVGMLNNDIKVHHFDRYSEVKINGKNIQFYTDLDKLQTELLRFAANEKDKQLVKFFVRNAKKCTGNAITTDKPYHYWGLKDVVKLLWKIRKFLFVMKRTKGKSIRDFCSELTSPELKFVFGDNIMPDEYSLFSLISTFGGICCKNGGIPIGGSKAMVERAKEEYLKRGGKLRLHTDVEKIIVENDVAKGVLLKDGTTIDADYVIPACDLHFTLSNLLEGKYSIPALEKRDAEPENNPVYSLYMASFRTKKDLSNIAANRYVKVSDFDFLGRKCSTLYIKHFGYDPTQVINGQTVVQCIITTFADDYDRLAAMSREEYVAFKKDMAETIEKKIIEGDGDLYGDLELLDVATPLTFTHYVNAYKGTFMTYMLTKDVEQMKIPNNALPIKNLALAGHWVMVPGGIPIAALQGKFAALTIQEVHRQTTAQHQKS